MEKFVILGTLPGLNDYISSERSSRFKAASMKKKCETVVMHSARSLGKWRAKSPVYMVYNWYEPNRRRDKDNICAFGRKVIQDALVRAKFLKNDGWKDISGFEDKFYVDQKNPRIVVEIYEKEE